MQQKQNGGINIGTEVSKMVDSLLSEKQKEELRRSIQQTADQAINAVHKVNDAIQSANSEYRAPEVRKPEPVSQNVLRRQVPHKKSPVTIKKIKAEGAKGALGIALVASGALYLGHLLWMGFSEFFHFIFLVLIGVELAAYFSGKKKRQKRLVAYQIEAERRTVIPLDDLAGKAGIGKKRVRRELSRLLASGKLPEWHLDDEKEALLVGAETYEHYLLSQEKMQKLQEQEKLKQERLQSLPERDSILELERSGERFIEQIRAVNDALPEEEISARLSDLEHVTGKIFGYVEQHPEKLPQIRRFMNYYLPTTLKVMEAYRELDSRGSGLDEVEKTKQEIKQALGNINLAFENLFYSLLQNDMLHVSADISALETMLAQEGLTPGIKNGEKSDSGQKFENRGTDHE